MNSSMERPESIPHPIWFCEMGHECEQMEMDQDLYAKQRDAYARLCRLTMKFDRQVSCEVELRTDCVARIDIDYTKDIFVVMIRKSVIDHDIDLDLLKRTFSIDVGEFFRFLDLFMKFIWFLLFKPFSHRLGCSKSLLTSLHSCLFLIAGFSYFVHGY